MSEEQAKEELQRQVIRLLDDVEEQPGRSNSATSVLMSWGSGRLD